VLAAAMIVRAIALRRSGRRGTQVCDLVQRVVTSGDAVAIDRFGNFRGTGPKARHLLGHFPDSLELFLQKRIRHHSNSLLPLIVSELHAKVGSGKLLEKIASPHEIERVQ
jgi:hypothetical protein